MNPSHHARVGNLFERALELPRGQRVQFVTDECLDDPSVREDVMSLLEAHESAGEYFDDFAENVIAPALTALSDASSETLESFQAKVGEAYRVERELAGGGMSRVFVAEDVKLKRRVVIKVLPREMVATANADRFQREIELAARLQHPHIVPLLATESIDGTWYYTMPFIDGETLQAKLKRVGALSIDEATRIWRDILDALAYAHANGVIHRDVKPANILLTGRHALVTDFGIARAIETAAGDAWATTAGLAIGTPAYMAPEQASGEQDVDERIDIYAAGLLMYEMLEGSPPFSGATARELLQAHLTRPPPTPARQDVSANLQQLVMQCLAKDAASRPRSIEAVLATLDDHHSNRSKGRLWVRRVAPYAVVLLALAVVITTVSNRNKAAGVSSTEALPVIAVLPLANVGGDSADAPLANGVIQEITSILGKNEKLRVIANTSVSALKQPMDARQIASWLGATHVLEGNLQKSGSRLRIQVRLIDARDGSTRWSESYDRAFADVFDMQDDIARAVAGELAVRLAPEPADGASRTPNIAAYEWYLRGMDIALLRTRAGQLKGVEHFNRAIAIDSTYAAAYAGLARMYLSLWNAAPPSERAEFFERAGFTARKAVALEPANAQAVASLGWFLLASRKYDEAEATLKRAISIDHEVPRGHEGLARVYMMVDRPAEQLTTARISVEQDPLSHSAIREHALALATNGRCEESLEGLRALKTLTPPANVAGILRGQCYASRGMWPQAISEFRWAAGLSSTFGLAFLGYALARAGQRDEAAQILSDLLSGRKHSHGAFGIAVVYYGMRDFDQVFAWLDRAIADNSINAYIMHPLFSEMHREPRFRELMKRQGVPES